MNRKYEKLTVLAPAKLNLSLDILGKASGGYHDLDSVMLAVDLCDTLTLTGTTGEGISFSCTDHELPTGEGNLALKAAGAFFAHTGIFPGGLDIALTKRIPIQAGLAGGSADAAGVLAGLNRLYGAGIGEEELARLGLGIGSDLPFCLMGGLARAKGRGEILTPLPPLPESAIFVIAKPAEGMSTRLAFEMYDKRRGASSPPFRTQALIDALASGKLDAVGAAMSNAFEDVLQLSGVREIKAVLLEFGAYGAAMTGSGTAVAGLFGDEREAISCLERLRGMAPFACLARPVAHGPKIM